VGGYARVAVAVAGAHLDGPFDYGVPDGWAVEVGHRVRVDFAGQRPEGWVTALADEPATDVARVKPLRAHLSAVPCFDAPDLTWLRWVADRWAGTLAATLRLAVPGRVVEVDRDAARWGPPLAWRPADAPPCPAGAWKPYPASRLLNAAAARAEPGAWWLRPLPGDDAEAMLADLVNRCLAAGRRALVLAPDPGSPLLDLALGVAGPAGADLRAVRPGEGRGQARRRRYRDFLRVRLGHAGVVAGERGAALTPVPGLGLVVVADEANPAWKERRTPRHHARDAALGIARLRRASAVITGALPSAGLWRHLGDGHVTAVRPSRTVERERHPRVDVIDTGVPLPSRRGRLAAETNRALADVVAAGGAAVVLAARRGEGTRLACRACRARRACAVCDSALAPAGDDGGGDGAPPTQGRSPTGGGAPGRSFEPADDAAGQWWRCATCGWAGPAFACSECGAFDTAPLAAGAGRLANELARAHPDAAVARMEGFDADGPATRPAIGVLTRGSVVARPGWLGGQPAGVAVLPDADAWLARPRLDAAEDALRLWLALARWCQRLVVQTREPANPTIQALVRGDPDGFWAVEAERRAELRFPPAASLARLSCRDPGDAEAVAAEVRPALPAGDELWGPDPDGGLLVKADDVRATVRALAPLRVAWDRDDRGVRVDVDPVQAL
jgi:primosomal protein N' (replication factor Y)